MVRLIGMDMDGTLLGDEGKTISEENLRALREAEKAGIALAICSGRTPEDASFYASDAHLDSMRIIALNGAWTLDKPHGACIDAGFMGEQTARKLRALADRYDELTYSWFRGNDLVLSEKEKPSEKPDLAWGTHLQRGTGRMLYELQGFEERVKDGFCKLVCIAHRPTEQLAALGRDIEETLPELEVSSSWSNNLEIMPRGVSKGAALTKLAAGMGIDMRDVMAIGDNENDLSMLTAAGWGVAMGNGTENVLKACPYRTLDNLHDGVAWAIRKWALEARG